MKTSYFTAAASAAAILTTLFCAAPAQASCASNAAALKAGAAAAAARTNPFAMPSPAAVRSATTFANADATTAEVPITGYWYTRFTAGGQLIDDGFDIWLSDGTEILNDTTAPSSGAVCLGVWTKTAPYTYTLKHPTWLFDSTGVNLVGIGLILEKITVNSTGDTYTGTSELYSFDLSGNLLQHLAVEVTGQRIQAVDTVPSTGGIPGLPRSILNR